jgi:hypothetical protein
MWKKKVAAKKVRLKGIVPKEIIQLQKYTVDETEEKNLYGCTA